MPAIVSSLFLAAALACPPAKGAPPAPPLPAPPDLASLLTTWDKPPAPFQLNVSTAGMLLGNGSMAACLGGPAERLRFIINRNDFWRMKGNVSCAQKVGGFLEVQINASSSRSRFLILRYSRAWGILPAWPAS
jgi:hypothetical protein